MKQGQKAFVFGRLVLIAAMCFPGLALAATQAGVVLVATGSVKALGSDGVVRELTRRSPVFAGDQLGTGSGARAQVKFTDGAIVGLKPNTELRIDDYAYETAGAQTSVMSLLKGGFRTVTGAIGKSNKSDYRVTTPVATIGIRGTLYDANLVPDEGLGLAVWDGGISACNSGGCLDLGAGADFRYGFISVNGKREGRNEPVSDESGSDEQGAGTGTGSSSLGEIANDKPAVDISLLPVSATNEELTYPYAGFATVASARANPWGTARTLDIDTARANAAVGGDWALRSATLGGDYINPGMICGDGDVCSNYLVPEKALLGASGETEVVWGYWYGNDVSVGADDGMPTDDAIINPGMFVLGTYASPAVVGTMTGTTSFSLYTAPTVIDGIGYQSTAPSFIGGLDYLTTASSASGSMSVDLANGTASGALSFQNAPQSTWNLSFGGTVSTQGMALALVTDVANPASGSNFVSSAQAGGVSPLAVQGAIDAKFVGATSVDGVVGAFDVETVDKTRAAQGVFIMQRTPDAAAPN